MSEHDDRRDHDAKADELERELDDMQEDTDKLGDQIESAGEEWGRRKADERVPTGEPSDVASGEDEDEDEDGGEKLDFGRSLGDDDGDDAA